MSNQKAPLSGLALEHAKNITAKIIEFNDLAAALGQQTGVEFVGKYDLEPYEEYERKWAREGAVGTMAAFLSHSFRFVSLEKIGDRWGLYYAPGVLLTTSKAEGSGQKKVRLQDAPLEIRERFLAIAGDFFERYEKFAQEAQKKAKEQASLQSLRETAEKAFLEQKQQAGDVALAKLKTRLGRS